MSISLFWPQAVAIFGRRPYLCKSSTCPDGALDYLHRKYRNNRNWIRQNLDNLVNLGSRDAKSGASDIFSTSCANLGKIWQLAQLIFIFSQSTLFAFLLGSWCQSASELFLFVLMSVFLTCGYFSYLIQHWSCLIEPSWRKLVMCKLTQEIFNWVMIWVEIIELSFCSQSSNQR